MLVIDELRAQGACAYVMLMWQIEGILRANNLDIDRLEESYIASFPEDKRPQERQWLIDLIAMMREEGKQESGHLQIVQGTVTLLTDLHKELLRSPKHPFYSATYYKALPYIVELRAKGNKATSEIETCLEAIYGVSLLELQKKEVNSETKAAVAVITQLMVQLSDAYKKDRAGELEL
ncbi:MAG: DUF4924 family protein [Bacteroidaceae bacterium]|nr:DUF4924 family protein [Bacteroidaceae bacterium]